MLFTWDDIYERADGAACGERTLKAKDNARYEVTEFVKRIGGEDIEKKDCPEDALDDYCVRFDIKFDKDGHIKRIYFPHDIARIVYATMQEEYRTQDIIECAKETFGVEDLSNDTIQEILGQIRDDANVSYNDMIEQAVREVLK